MELFLVKTMPAASAPRDLTLLRDAGDRAEVIDHLTMRRPALESSFGRSFNHCNPCIAQSMQGTACFRFCQLLVAPVSKFKVLKFRLFDLTCQVKCRSVFVSSAICVYILSS